MDTTFRHRIPIQLRMNDIDFLGHVNNAVLMEFFDLGKLHYLRGFDTPMDLQQKSKLVIVHHEIDFVQQIYFEDEIYVETRTEKFGNKSMHMQQRIIDDKGVVRVNCRTILSGFDPVANTSDTIPEDFKKTVLEYEGSFPLLP